MLKGMSFLFLFSYVLWGGSAYCQSSVGNSTLRIVRNHDAAPPIQFAVGELAKYLRLMGNAPPVVIEEPKTGDIYVGMIPNDASSEQRRAMEASVRGNPDSFVIRTLGEHAGHLWRFTAGQPVRGLSLPGNARGSMVFSRGRERICSPCAG